MYKFCIHNIQHRAISESDVHMIDMNELSLKYDLYTTSTLYWSVLINKVNEQVTCVCPNVNIL